MTEKKAWLNECERATRPGALLRVEFAPDFIEHYKLIPPADGQESNSHGTFRHWFDVEKGKHKLRPCFYSVHLDLTPNTSQWGICSGYWKIKAPIPQTTKFYYTQTDPKHVQLEIGSKLWDDDLDSTRRCVVVSEDVDKWLTRLSSEISSALESVMPPTLLRVVCQYLSFMGDSCWIDVFTGPQITHTVAMRNAGRAFAEAEIIGDTRAQILADDSIPADQAVLADN